MADYRSSQQSTQEQSACGLNHILLASTVVVLSPFERLLRFVLVYGLDGRVFRHHAEQGEGG